MHNLLRVHNSRGFSLIQIMIAMGLTAVMTLGIAAAMTYGFQGMAHQDNMGIAQDAQAVIAGLLGDPNYCTVNFSGLPVPAAGAFPRLITNAVDLKELTSLGALGSTSILTSGMKYEKLTVVSLKLNARNIVGPNRYLGSLDLQLMEPTGFKMTFNRSIPLMISTDGANNILSCSRAMDPTQGVAQGVYSKDCTNFASAGWPSQQACLQDGRWHLVYQINGGIVTAGSLAQLKTTVQETNSIAVQMLFPGLQGYWTCSGSYVSAGGRVYCLTSAAWGGETPAFWNTGVARLSDQGTINCQNISNPGVDTCVGITIDVAWWARY